MLGKDGLLLRAGRVVQPDPVLEYGAENDENGDDPFPGTEKKRKSNAAQKN
jgi:hypothetical protein